MGHLGKARDAQARAIARARLMRDDARVNSREWHDANVVVVDLETVGKLLDGVGEAVARPVDVGAAASPPKGYTTPSPQQQAEQAGPATPKPTGLDRVRACAAKGCRDCLAAVSMLDSPDAPPVVVYAAMMRDKTPFGAATRDPQIANGVGVTDTAG